MKKVIIISALLFFFTIGCDTRTYQDISENIEIAPTVKYTDHVKPIIESNCVSCHYSNGSASFYPLTNYELVKTAIDNILLRVQKPIGDPEKMPQGGSLSQQNIDILKKWKTDGLQE